MGVVFPTVLFAYDFRLLFRRGPFLNEKMPLDGSGITCLAFCCNKGLQDKAQLTSVWKIWNRFRN